MPSQALLFVGVTFGDLLLKEAVCRQLLPAFDSSAAVLIAAWTAISVMGWKLPRRYAAMHSGLRILTWAYAAVSSGVVRTHPAAAAAAVAVAAVSAYLPHGLVQAKPAGAAPRVGQDKGGIAGRSRSKNE